MNSDREYDRAHGQADRTWVGRTVLLSALAGMAVRLMIKPFFPSLEFTAYMVVFIGGFTYTFALRELGQTRTKGLLSTSAAMAIFGTLMWASDRWL